jgi:hypothetical protein
VVSEVMIDSYWAAVELNSVARLFHAVAAAINGPAPAPEYRSPEVISGGNAAKDIYLSVLLA